MIVAGRQLEVRIVGSDGALAPIVMLHEGLGSVSMWRDFPEQLAVRTGRRTIAYSRYGYGRSDVLDAARAVDYMHREGEVVLPALLAELGVRRPVLFGHSDGASIALLFAASDPQGCRALVLEAPHVFVEPLTVESIARTKTLAATTDLLERLARHHADAPRTFAGWNDIWLDPAFRAWDITANLDRIAVPVLAVQGNNDEYGTAAQIEAIAARVPGVRTVFIEHAGHSPHRSDPERVLAATADFLAGVP